MHIFIKKNCCMQKKSAVVSDGQGLHGLEQFCRWTHSASGKCDMQKDKAKRRK